MRHDKVGTRLHYSVRKKNQEMEQQKTGTATYLIR
jgi:hypothetical protein